MQTVACMLHLTHAPHQEFWAQHGTHPLEEDHTQEQVQQTEAGQQETHHSTRAEGCSSGAQQASSRMLSETLTATTLQGNYTPNTRTLKTLSLSQTPSH